MLIERKPTACRLTRAQVDFLLAEHRAHIQVAPTGRRGWYRLTPTGHVGTIVGPTCRLAIRPKIPINNLFHLLDPTGPLPAIEDSTATAPGAEGLDFLAGRLAYLLEERATAGLHRAYAERAEQGPFLRGRLDLPAHLRDRSGRKDQLHCRYEDFTADVSCNQLPKATAELVLRSPLLGERVRTALRKSLESFAAIRSIPVGPDSFAATPPDRLTEAYQPLLRLCRLLVESLGPGDASGTTPCPTFLLDMERVFERYVTEGVARAFAGSARWAVAVQPFFLASQSQAGQPDLHLRPDFTLENSGRLVLIGDAKWKQLSPASLGTTDVYQVLAYCTALGVHRGLLVYPGRRDRCWWYPLVHSPVSLEIRTVRVLGTREACERSLRRFSRALRQTVR
jgi:5-methylcytosine-specific restriction enzyme subunit McrC